MWTYIAMRTLCGASRRTVVGQGNGMHVSYIILNQPVARAGALLWAAMAGVGVAGMHTQAQP